MIDQFIRKPDGALLLHSLEIKAEHCSSAFAATDDPRFSADHLIHNRLRNQNHALNAWYAQALKGHTLKSFIEERYGYDLSGSLDEIRPTYYFNESCQATVPQAITAFIESTDFEDAIRNAISLGGDSDTLAAITGSIAEAAY